MSDVSKKTSETGLNLVQQTVITFFQVLLHWKYCMIGRNRIRMKLMVESRRRVQRAWTQHLEFQKSSVAEAKLGILFRSPLANECK